MISIAGILTPPAALAFWRYRAPHYLSASERDPLPIKGRDGVRRGVTASMRAPFRDAEASGAWGRRRAERCNLIARA